MKEPTYERSRVFASRRMDGELILVPVSANAADMDSIFVLNSVASLIWESLESRTFTEVVAVVSATFSVSTVEAELDARSLIDELVTMKAVRAVAGVSP